MERLDNPLPLLRHLRERQKRFGENTLAAVGAGLAFVPAAALLHPGLGIGAAGVSIFTTVVNAEAYDHVTGLADNLEASVLEETFPGIST